MERNLVEIAIHSVDQIPSLEVIRSWPRDQKVKLEFAESVQGERASIGAMLKRELSGFLVGIHIHQPEISIAKLITEEEIEANQDFFEQCAKDYRQLAGELMYQWVKHLGLVLDLESPLKTFNPLKMSGDSNGKMRGWRYCIHGFHCDFTHLKTGQYIEVPLVWGLEFGDLDPYFFTQYILSTPSYHPLPVPIYEAYWDGVRINDKMLALGKFEYLEAQIGSSKGIVVADRQPLDPRPFEALNRLNAQGNHTSDAEPE